MREEYHTMANETVTSMELLQLLEDHPENLKLFRTKAPDEAVRSLVSQEITDEDAKKLADGVMKDPVIQLYVASDGSIDGRELMDYVRNSRTATRSGAENAGVRSLLNGKLDIKTLLMIVALMKMFSGSNQQSTQGGSLISSLLGTTLGMSQSGNTGSLGLLGSLFGAGSQTPASTQSSMGLLGSLLSASQPQQVQQPQSLLGTLLGASQPQQVQQPQAQSQQALLNALLSTAQAQAQSQQAQTQAQAQSQQAQAQAQQSLLGSLLSASQAQPQSQQVQQPASSGILGQLLSAGMSQQAQTQTQAQGQQVYALDGTKPQQFTQAQTQQIQNLLSGSDSVHSNGQINVGNLFSIASALMGK